MNVCAVECREEAAQLQLTHNPLTRPSSSIQPLSFLPYSYTAKCHYKISAHNSAKHQFFKAFSRGEWLFSNVSTLFSAIPKTQCDQVNMQWQMIAPACFSEYVHTEHSEKTIFSHMLQN